MKKALSLLPGETIVLVFRKHWIMLFFDTIGTVVTLFIPFVAFFVLSHLGYVPEFLQRVEILTFTSSLWLLLVWCTLAVLWTDYYLDIWIITNTRVITIAQIDLFNRSVSNWGVDRIQEITAHHENIVQTFFNYGTLRILTAGPSDEYGTARGVPNPDHVRTVIMEQINHAGKLTQINNQQQELLHTVNHEVKSYLTRDAAALAAIAEGGIDNRSLRNLAERALKETRSGVAALIHLLNGATSTATALIDTVDIKTMVDELVQQYSESASKKGVTLKLLTGNSPCVVRGDAVALRDLVFKNLIDNAIRYTPQGNVLISLAADGKDVHFSIEDSGVGISPRDMEKLFTPGGHGEHSKDVNPESTGYGLSSAKSAVEAHNGRIWAKSEGPEHGATFFVELPVA